MLIQEKISGSDTLLKLYGVIDEDLKVPQPPPRAKQLPRCLTDGIIVGDGGYFSQAKVRGLAHRGVYLLTTTRKNMRHVASQFQLACLQLRHRVEELFAFLKCAFGAVRTTHRAAYALPIHLLSCLLAYSLYKSLID